MSHDEKGYRAWVFDHPNGYVINTTRSRSPDYMVLHRASCTQVWQYTDMVRPGGFTERESIKVCGLGLDAMRAWAKLHGRPDGTFSKICGICQPAPTPLGTGVVR